MSDNIPLEIQTDILKRLPVKSLLRSRSVSKPWKSLIDSSEFIADFSLSHTEPHHLFVSYKNNNNNNNNNNKHRQKFVSYLDDITFPQHKFPLNPSFTFNVNQLRNARIIDSSQDDDVTFSQHKFPLNPTFTFKLNQLRNARIIGSSQGLFCFYSYNINIKDISRSAVIWNPSIRKSVFIPVPNVLPSPYETVIGFGVCPRTNHPKLVKFVYIEKVRFLPPQREFVPIVIPPRVEICTSKSRVWRFISNNLPRESIALTAEHVAIDRFIYWLGFNRNYASNNTTYCSNLILLFDITNEVFTEEVKLPDGLQGACEPNMRVSKLTDSLIVLDKYVEFGYQIYSVWMMENDFSKSFRKLYTIKAPDASIRNILGFRKSGEPIIQITRYSVEDNGLFVYDPDTEQVNSIGISGIRFSYFASSYVESLLLLDH